MATTNHDLDVMLHAELQQGEELRKQLLDELGDISGMLQSYREYKYKISSDGDMEETFSEYVELKQRGESVETTKKKKKSALHSITGKDRDGSRGNKYEEFKPPVVTPNLISTTSLLAKLTHHSANKE